MKIELPKTKFPSSICKAGNKKPFLSGVTASESGGVKTLEVTFSGVFNDLAELQNESCKIGSIELPGEVSSISDSEGSIAWICEGSTLRLGTGGIAELLSKWRSRNDRETDEDCANGLLSRTISVRRIERQETLEHYAARIRGSEDEAADSKEGFKEAYFNLWRQEMDPAVRSAFMVRVPTIGSDGEITYGDPLPLYSENATDEPVANKLTKKVAERWAQGVSYASEFFVRVEVQEIWRKVPSSVPLKCNVILTNGIPENHRPLWKPNDYSSVDALSWMREATEVLHDTSGLYRVNTAYIGMNNRFKPNPVPTDWGDTPFDEMLYEKESGSSGESGGE